MNYFYVLLLLFALSSTLKFRVDKKKFGHIFVLGSFYYPQSSLYSKYPTDTIVTLFNIGMEDGVAIPKLKGHCLTGAIPQPKPANFLLLVAGGPKCLITIFRMVCFPANPTINFAVRFNKAAPIKVNILEPQTKKREVVVCPGRMFAFEQWHLFVTAMELNRLHRVDLVVVYIQSVDSVVYDLIKLYEAEELVMIRSSLLMPSHLKTLSYNPNDEMVFNNQVANFQECLYEFRESASFIAFPDWDDLIVTPNSKPLPSVLSELSEQFPKSCSFIFGRYLGVIEDLGAMSLHHFSLSKLWREGVLFTMEKYEENHIQKMGKAVVRPQCVNVVGFHEASILQGLDQNDIPFHSTYIIHARDYHEFALTSKLEQAEALIANFDAFQQRHPEFQQLHIALPKNASAVDQFNNCLGFGNYNSNSSRTSRYERIMDIAKNSKCFSYSLCGIHSVEIAGTCFNARNEWKTRITSDLSISTLESRSLVHEADCIV